ncbi:MAG: hypothetical protein U0903_19830 [Planctomycetales bacterium]
MNANGIEIADQIAGDVNLAIVGLMGTGDDLDERGLAGTVLTDEGVDFSRGQVEGDLLQGVDAAEVLGDIGELEEVRHDRFR